MPLSFTTIILSANSPQEFLLLTNRMNQVIDTISQNTTPIAENVRSERIINIYR